MDWWKIKDNSIFFFHENEERYMNSKELYNSSEGYLYNSKLVISPFEALNISKGILPLNCILKINIINEKINIDIYALRKGEKYKLFKNSKTIGDNIIIEDKWYFINGNYNIYMDIIDDCKIEDLTDINFNQFMSLARELKKRNVEYIDNVNVEIDHLKSSNNSFQAEGLKAKLYPYQECGCNWLRFMMDNKCGCILGDEMGLGKTLQIIALLGEQKNKNPENHFLVVCPVSLLDNWQREINKFYPSLKCIIHHGNKRTGFFRELLNYDVVIMSYSNIQSDLEMINMIKWNIVILDEAQNIKNPYAIRTEMVKKINRDKSIAVTGTPFENHMTDIWSIVDFIIPNYLGKISEFIREYQDDLDSASKLESVISPIMLRRLVKDVAKDLPNRIDIPQPIEMTESEALLYEDERRKNTNLEEITIEKIQGLRMFCTHPIVYNNGLRGKDPALLSNKYARLCEILSEIFANKEKALVFTSFNEMINIIVEDIKNRFGVYTNYINGSVESSNRQKIIDDFSSVNGPGVLVLNPRAAGSGLNIVCANNVIHYNLEWNPAIEDQASARAYRRGQEKNVFVYRLFYANTIEDVINDRIQFKRDISENAIIGNKGTEEEKEALIRALSISPVEANNGN